MITPPLLFSDYFDIDPGQFEDFGALNICLEPDLPLFMDPFLLFASNNAGNIVAIDASPKSSGLKVKNDAG